LPARASIGVSGTGNWTLIADLKPRDFSIPLTVGGRLEPESSVVFSNQGSRISLNRGTVHLRAFGPVEVDIGPDIRVLALNSDFSIIAGSDTVTVVTLTASVLVTQGENVWILPPGHQLVFENGSVRRVSVPAEWLTQEQTQYQTLSELDIHESIPDGANIDALITGGSYKEALSLVRASTVSVPLNHSTAARLLAKVLAADGLFDADRVSLAFALGRLGDFPQLSPLIAICLVQDGDRTADEAAVLIRKELSAPVIFSDLPAALPMLAAATVRPLSAGATDLWAKSLIRLAAADGKKAFESLHQSAPGLPARYFDAGYPKQAKLWAEAVTRSADILMPLLKDSSDRQALLSDQRTVQRYGFKETGPAVQSSDSAILIEKSRFSEDELMAQTRKMLSGHGVLFSSLTTIKVTDEQPDSVRIDGIFRAENGHDVPYAFTYDVASGRILGIVRDGMRLPNSLTVDQFFK
jgi:hypothetical protein